MSKILKLDPSYDLWLTYSWSANNHGICGHVFETIDYFYILTKYFKVGILFAEDISWDVIERAIRSRYNFSDDEVQNVKINSFFNNRPRVVYGKNILFVDGGVLNTSGLILCFDNIFYFACGNKEVKDNNKDNVYILQDDRVYESVKKNGINYKKKILFDRLKTITNSEDNLLIYITKNCRRFVDFDELKQYEKPVLAITNEKNTSTVCVEGITFVTPPIENLFERFTTYVYTPISRKWDCSPRLIAECKYYNKNVIYHNIDYWDIDRGLYWRKWDIENDFPGISLKENDDIITILQNIIGGQNENL